MTHSTWRLTPPTPPHALEPLTRTFSVDPLVAHLMHQRGITPTTTLTPTLELAAIPNLHDAAREIATSIRRSERIMLHGDYDADGITGTAILTLGLQALGANVASFIPNRISDGYGLNHQHVERLAARADLLISIDCGITATSVVTAYQERGTRVIITDHHAPGETLPDTLIVHPSAIAQQEDFDLTGAGVAWHLLWATRQALNQPDAPTDLIDLAAIGTIADVATLTTPNRTLIQHGLEQLHHSTHPGLRSITNDLTRPLTTTDVGFTIGPLINAAGRLSQTQHALELLTTRDHERANELLKYLKELNEHRKLLTEHVTEGALARVDPNDPAIVLDDPEWHPGVIGIACSKLVEHTGKSAFLSSGGKGSVRVAPGHHALDALTHARDALDTFGGHAAAAGYAVKPDQHERFRASIHAYATHTPNTPREHAIDAIIEPRDIHETLLNELASLHPHGPGNPAPTLALIQPLHSTRIIGKQKNHLQIRLAHPHAAQRGVAWNAAHLHTTLTPGATTLAITELGINEWNGQRNIEFTAKHLQPHTPIPSTTNHHHTRHTRHHDHPTLTTQHALTTNDHTTLPPAGESVTLHTLPNDPQRALALLQTLNQHASRTHYALNQDDLTALERSVAQLLTRERLRVAMRGLVDGDREPSEQELVVLRELDLLRADGTLKRERRNPYESVTLREHVMTRYALTSVVQLYRFADEGGFDAGMRALLRVGVAVGASQ